MSGWRQRLSSRLVRNVISNYAGTVWLALLSLLSIPIYVHALGRQSWGLVAASLAVQMFMNFLDAGLSQVMPRWLARTSDDRYEQAKLYRIFSTIYIGLGGGGFVLGQLSAGFLARTWFNTGSVPPEQLEWALRIVLVQLFFQFANSANTGFWNGVQKQSLANFRQCLFTSLKHAGALAAIFLIARSPFCYLLSFAIFGCIEFFCNRVAVVHELGAAVGQARHMDRREARAIVVQAGSLSVAVLIGTLVSQLDRIVLTKTQSVTDFGTYVIVANLAMAFFQLQAPLTRAFLPRISQDFRDGGTGKGETIRRLFLAMCAFCVLPCLLAAMFVPQMLHLWLHNDAIVAAGSLPLRLLLLAVALNSLYNVFYPVLIAAGRGAFVMVINLLCLGTSLLAVFFAGSGIGIVLGGVIWVTSSTTQLLLGSGWYLVYGRRIARTRGAAALPAQWQFEVQAEGNPASLDARPEQQ